VPLEDMTSQFNQGAGESKPLSHLADAQNFSPIYNNDKIGEVDFISSDIPGFTSNATELFLTDGLIIQGSSNLNRGPINSPLVEYLTSGGQINGEAPNASAIINMDNQIYDPRPDTNGIPSFTISGIQNKNSYNGSIFDDLLGTQISPFSNDAQIAGYVSTTPGPTLPFTSEAEWNPDTGNPPLKYYDNYHYDPRDDKTVFGRLIPITNKNPYTGTMFDDTLADNVQGGGLFDSGDTPYGGSTGYRIPPNTSAKDIAQTGNFGVLINDQKLGGELYEANLAITNFENTTGITLPTPTTTSQIDWSGGTAIEPYASNTEPVIGDGLGNHSPILEKGSWLYNGSIQTGFPDVNTYISDTIPFGNASERSNIVVTSDGVHRYTSDSLASQDLTLSTIATTQQFSLVDDRLHIYNGSDTMNYRGLEPYYTSSISPAGVNTPPPYTDDFGRFKKFMDTSAGANFRINSSALANTSHIKNVVNHNYTFFNNNDGHNTQTDGPYPAPTTRYTELDGNGYRPFSKFSGTQETSLDGSFIPEYLWDGSLSWKDKGKKAIKQGVRLSLATLERKMKGPPRGDFLTLTPMNEGSVQMAAYPETFHDLESDLLPFYIKDMRDNSFIFFRAYIEGLTENVSADWNEETFVGRSESVFTYTKANRDISFSLKVYAHTQEELDMIYRKINRLTSLCYPDYQTDNINFMGKMRPKPPITKLRLGELYGKANKELGGFIKSLTYSFPENSTWETQRGKRVPKHAIISITYQVIHDRTPNMDTNFIGKKPLQDSLGALAGGFVDGGWSGVAQAAGSDLGINGSSMTATITSAVAAVTEGGLGERIEDFAGDALKNAVQKLRGGSVILPG
tara:strand:- start:3817 stop:6369 length:2553 start_codon:yes stop_codon:yes gene_type:complete